MDIYARVISGELSGPELVLELESCFRRFLGVRAAQADSNLIIQDSDIINQTGRIIEDVPPHQRQPELGDFFDLGIENEPFYLPVLLLRVSSENAAGAKPLIARILAHADVVHAFITWDDSALKIYNDLLSGLGDDLIKQYGLERLDQDQGTYDTYEP